MTTTTSRRRHRTVWVVLLSLITAITLAGTGVATAQWIIAATTTTPLAAGSLTTELAGSEQLGAADIADHRYTAPVALTLRNPGLVPVDHTLSFTPHPGTLHPADIEVAVWQPAGAACGATVPDSGVATGPLTSPPSLPVTGAPGESETVVCAATRFTGTLFGSAGNSLTAVPTLTAQLTGGTWTATDTGTGFTHTIAPAPAPVTNLRCENVNALLLLPAGVELRWDPVDGATGGYEVTFPTGRTVSTDTPHIRLSLLDTGNSPSWAEVTALGVTGASTATRQALRVGALLGLIDLVLRCPR